jgi:hypothetical protein
MKSFFSLSVMCFALLAGACAPIRIESTFDPKEAVAITKQGRAKIEGQAFLRQRGGSVVTAAGNTVNLIPASTYARERFAKIYNGRKFAETLLPADTRDASYVHMMRSTIADAQGNFVFDNVAPGEYFVQTQVTWSVPGRYLLEGGSMWELVKIGDRNPPKLILTDQ